MVDGKGMLKPELSEEGLQPNRAGYKIIAPPCRKSDRNRARTPATIQGFQSTSGHGATNGSSRDIKMKSFSLCVFWLLILSVCALSQQAAPALAAIPSTGFAGLDQYRASRVAVFTDDFGQLARYRAANAALGAPAAGENRVVFFGDSITDMWKLEDSFPGQPYVNRGIGGQTTPQMLVRFRQDVIDLQPKVVVMLAGTNDIAGNSGPMRDPDIEANFASFAELARYSLTLRFSFR